MTEHDAVIAILKRMLQRAISRRPEPACDVGRWTTVRYGPPCANDEAFSAPDRAADAAQGGAKKTANPDQKVAFWPICVRTPADMTFGMRPRIAGLLADKRAALTPVRMKRPPQARCASQR